MTDKTATTAAQDAAFGWPVPGWRGATPPDPRAIDGRYCRIEPLVMAHASQLHEAYHAEGGTVNWDYLPYGPFETLDDFEAFLEGTVLATIRCSTPFLIRHRAGQSGWQAISGLTRTPA
jgi:hypothetical protein